MIHVKKIIDNGTRLGYSGMSNNNGVNMVNSRYELTLIEEGFDKDGKLEHRRETKYNPDEVRKLRMGLDQDIVNFFEEQEEEHLFFTHLYNAAMREYTTPKFEVQPVTYECSKCGYDDLPDDKVDCPKCK